MNGLLESLLSLTTTASDFIWGVPMVVLLFGTGLLLSWKTGFVQIRNFSKAVRLVLTGSRAPGSEA